MDQKIEIPLKVSASSEVDDPDHDDEFQLLLKPLEKRMNWNGRLMCLYDGFWCPVNCLKPLLCCQKNFKSHGTDIILSTMPKSGTTWLKALTFSIVNRSSYSIDEHHPVLTSNPHTLVPFFEFSVYMDHQNPDLENIPSPRIFATHIHYDQLPNSIKDSNCRLIYLCRDPKDQFVSYWYFMLKMRSVDNAGDQSSLSIEEAFEMYCEGIHGFGPVWKHMLEYWNAHMKNPEKVLFLKYEDLKGDIASNVKKIAEFIGSPFSVEEQNQGLIEQISALCSFESLKNLEVNKVGYTNCGVKNSSYFRKAETRDWINHLTPEMAERLEKIVESRLKGSGLMFSTCSNCSSDPLSHFM